MGWLKKYIYDYIYWFTHFKIKIFDPHTHGCYRDVIWRTEHKVNISEDI